MLPGRKRLSSRWWKNSWAACLYLIKSGPWLFILRGPWTAGAGGRRVWKKLPGPLEFLKSRSCRRCPLCPKQARSPGSEAPSRASRSLNLAPGMTVMTRVKVVRKVRGDPGGAVTLLGSVVSALLTHLTRSSPYASIIVPVSELTRRRLRDVFAAQSHTAWRCLSRARGGGPFSFLTLMTHGLLDNRTHNRSPLVNSNTSKATEG